MIKNLIIKKLKSAREKGELETVVENPENRLLDNFLIHVLTYKIITRTTSL